MSEWPRTGVEARRVIADSTLSPTERCSTLVAVAHGLSPMHPRQWEEIVAEHAALPDHGACPFNEEDDS